MLALPIARFRGWCVADANPVAAWCQRNPGWTVRGDTIVEVHDTAGEQKVGLVDVAIPAEVQLRRAFHEVHRDRHYRVAGRAHRDHVNGGGQPPVRWQVGPGIGDIATVADNRILDPELKMAGIRGNVQRGHNVRMLALPGRKAPVSLERMANANDVRKLALALPHVAEIPSEGFDFRVGNKGFVWSYPERQPGGPRVIRTDIAVLYVGDEAEKQALLLGEPDIFFTTPAYDGLPLVMLRLAKVTVKRLRELVTDAWHMRAPAELLSDDVPG